MNKFVAFGLVVLIAGCAQTRVPAPVESRNIGKPATTVQRASGSQASSSPMAPVPEGFYRVRRGDTVIGIALDHGVSWRDIVGWNQLSNANVIEIDQVLRVRPPRETRIASAPGVQDPKASVSAKPVAPPASTTQPQTVRPPAQTAPSASSSAPTAVAENIQFGWPGNGQIIAQFAEPGNKGISLAGAEGDAVISAGDGRVVYSGSGLRGYGNLVIVKHDADFLTAYAHNKSILVSEGQMVKRGQKIAELGRTDSDIPKLHFEVRKSGKPVDPLKFLPAR